MNRLVTCTTLLMIAGASAPASGSANPTSEQGPKLLQVYQVNKKVSDFPDKEDLSTPEASYAAANRIAASGDRGSWRRISVARLASKLPPADAKKREVSAEAAKEWLEAEILEVRIFRGTFASVFAGTTTTTKRIIDIRNLELHNGRWLNRGNDVVGTLDEARVRFSAACAYYAEDFRPSRRPMKDPDGYLKPFVEFLKDKGQEPKTLVMDALAKHKVVIMGEVHHRPKYWA
ncbi:MAG: hypothetical protein ACYSWU_19910, partial [Planctomycetota bacterium]